jgi:hypothetical protein
MATVSLEIYTQACMALVQATQEIARLRAELEKVTVPVKPRKASTKTKKVVEVIDPVSLSEHQEKIKIIRQNNGKRVAAFNKAKKDSFNELLECAQQEW